MAATAWWRDGVIYQIYPRSFQDSNGDGIGDLAGIMARADYLSWLGVDAVWFSPFFVSPMVDFGYDISNFTDIDAAYGSLAEFDEMVAALHRRAIKVILDFVPNHSSNRHPWCNSDDHAYPHHSPDEPRARLARALHGHVVSHRCAR